MQIDLINPKLIVNLLYNILNNKIYLFSDSCPCNVDASYYEDVTLKLCNLCHKSCKTCYGNGNN